LEDINLNIADETDDEDSDIVVDGYTGERITSVLKAVRKRCLDCCAYQRDEVKYCSCTNCALWPFRFGKNPYRKKREMSEEQRNAMKERMSVYWGTKNE